MKMNTDLEMGKEDEIKNPHQKKFTLAIKNFDLHTGLNINQTPEISEAKIQQQLDQDIFPTYYSSLINKKTNFSISQYITILCLVAFGFFMYSGFQVYGASKTEVELDKKQCLDLIFQAQSDGLDISNLSCPEIDVNFTEIFQQSPYKQIINSNKTKIIENKVSLQNKILENENKRQEYLKNLQVLEVKIPENLTINKSQENLQFKLNDLQDNLLELEKLLEQGYAKVDKMITTYNSSLNSLKAPTLAEKDYSKKLVNLSKSSKIEIYPELKSNLQKIQQHLVGEGQNLPSDILEYKVFSGQDFRDLYESIKYNNVAEPIKSEITGNKQADDRIAQIAQSRGYILRSQANQQNLQLVEGERLQPEAKEAYLEMKQSANKDGIKLLMISGFRSVDDQKKIFVSRLNDAGTKEFGRPYNTQEIAAGKADKAIENVLKTSSIPGYSRHHTGYTFDLNDGASKQGFTLFKNTPAYKWISSNNFYNAKKYGFIPSYPAGQSEVGPEPEEWEFVWVGKDVLKNEF